jgi:Predicted membrane protein
MLHDISAWLSAAHTNCTTTDTMWFMVGMFGQLFFASRFFVQLFYSEKAKKSVMPVAFWYISIGGGLITLVYSVRLGQMGLPFFIGQVGGLVVYARNLMLIYREKNRPKALDAVPAAPGHD